MAMTAYSIFIHILIASNGFFTMSTVQQSGQTHAERDTILIIEANPGSGFWFPYYLMIPDSVDRTATQYILIETTNTGGNDTFSYHERNAYLQTRERSMSSQLSRDLRIPLLVPVFPRPYTDWHLYTHAFDRDAAMIKKGQMKRLDLQLIAMFQDARRQLAARKITTHEKILMNGFSASGAFANRFAMIHPGMVACVAAGGFNGMLLLPLTSLEYHTLKYPLGTKDFKKLFGHEVDTATFQRVPQFYYMGEKDTNDAVLFDDAYSKRERKIIFNVTNQNIMRRYMKCQSVYRKHVPSAQFKTYAGIGHEINQEVYTDVLRFFHSVIHPE
jgi:hypothetical protein